MQDLTTFLSANESRMRGELFDLLRIPSVSARSEHNADTARAAEWVADAMRKIGLTATVHPTAGHPVVVGEWRKAPAGAQTGLIYGHYDVQPAEPLELWESPPFEPTVRDGKVFARGSVDDKGQLYLHVKALEAHLATRGTLPVNIIVLAEGEEEVGSENLSPFIEQHKDLLKCDGVVISDSGMFGGGIMNPAMALARILATMHDADGRVAIAGFYDKVQDWGEKARKDMRALPFKDETFLKDTGSPSPLGAE